MEQTKKTLAIKKLEQELKDEKQAEINRSVWSSSLGTGKFTLLLGGWKLLGSVAKPPKKGRDWNKKKQRYVIYSIFPSCRLHCSLQMGARKAARMRRKMGRTKKING